MLQRCSMSHRSSHIAISILAILAVSQPLSAAIYHSLALTGELAPGLSGTPYLRFDDNTRVAINSSGVVAFTGEAKGLGIWVGKPGDLSIAFVHGTTPPIPGL